MNSNLFEFIRLEFELEIELQKGEGQTPKPRNQPGRSNLLLQPKQLGPHFPPRPVLTPAAQQRPLSPQPSFAQCPRGPTRRFGPVPLVQSSEPHGLLHRALPLHSARRSPAAVAAQRPCSQPLTSRARMAALSPPRRNRPASTIENPGRNLAGFPISGAHAKAPSRPTNRSPVPPLLLPSRSRKP